MRAAIAIAATAALVAGCGPADERDAGSHAPSPAASAAATPSATLAEAPVVELRLRYVRNRGLGRTRGHIAGAIADLKLIGYWDSLTSQTEFLLIGSRPGRDDLPDDRHLADVLPSFDNDGADQLAGCDIVFYPAAMNYARRQWRKRYADGSVSVPPPTRRHQWAAVLGHELAHCLDFEAGEDFARGWEGKVSRALIDAGIE